MNLDQLTAWVSAEVGGGPRRALQIYKELWQRGARTFDEMETVALSARKQLKAKAYISFLQPEIVLRSKDGTVKYLWGLEDGMAVESVLIPEERRVTLCVSSQVGCAMACTFCLTGDLGLKRHLAASEIANQVLQVSMQAQSEGLRVTNLVFMGMGEPLHNLEKLCIALDICLEDHSLGFSHRKVTVSTVGLVPQMGELAARLPVNLAVSINATTEEQRQTIMPINRKYSLERLLDACRQFPLPNGKRITFEYVMMADFNDSLSDAVRLFHLLEGIAYKVNVIPYNENPNRTIRSPSRERVVAFQHYFVSRGKHCSVRTTRGTDISAACGQLGKAEEQAADRGWLNEARRLAGVTARNHKAVPR